MRLADALAALDARSFERLCRRHGIHIDPKKRLSPAEQAARQLVEQPPMARIDALPEAARNVAWLLATTPEGAPRLELGGGVLPLLDGDLVFPVPGRSGQVAMPAEFRVQLPPGPGEDRTSARALLAIQDDETWSLLGTQMLGRQPVGPAPIWMGAVLARLESPQGIREILSGLSPKQRRLLEAIEARGGQLETDELLELERSPIRVTTAALPTRSASYHLSIRGLLLPRSRGVWVIPAEVAAHVGAPRRAVERAERKRLLARVAGDEELSPPRARLAEDAGPLAVAVLAALRRRGALPSDGRGVRRSELKAVATEVGIEPQAAELYAALARAAGARFEAAPLAEAGAVLFATWRETEAWDEAREDPDVHRAGDTLASLPTPTRAVREIMLDLLEAMPPERFAPIEEVAQASVNDLRASGAPRLLERAAKRAGGRVLDRVPAIAERILKESLPRLGAADRARVDGREVVRLSARAREWMEGIVRPSPGASHWEGGRLRVGGDVRVRSILAAAEGAEAIASQGGLVLRVDGASVLAALERGLTAKELRERWSQLAAPFDAAAERALARGVEATRPRLPFVPVSAYLPVADANLRERLLAAPELAGMFAKSSPLDGLLVRPGVSREQLETGLTKLGVVLD